MWHSTSTIYKQYAKILSKDTKQLTYRRISEFLIELQNTGILTSQTGSKGRHGYGTQFKLLVSPEQVGESCFGEWWDDIVKQKTEHEQKQRRRDVWKPLRSRGSPGLHSLSNQLENMTIENWKKYLGQE